MGWNFFQPSSDDACLMNLLLTQVCDGGYHTIGGPRGCQKYPSNPPFAYICITPQRKVPLEAGR
jgi:hypothetical protein